MPATQDPQYYVYILTNRTRTLYVGVTNDLERRVYQHRNKLVPGFTSKYNVTRLAYYEQTSDVESAIVREKQIKSWRRSKKVELIESLICDGRTCHWNGAISVKKRFRPLAPLGVTWGTRGDMGALGVTWGTRGDMGRSG